VTKWDADEGAPAPEPAEEAKLREAQARAALADLQRKYGPPQPREPQKGQLGLPLDGGDEPADTEGES
jgi:hypothetical protein